MRELAFEQNVRASVEFLKDTVFSGDFPTLLVSFVYYKGGSYIAAVSPYNGPLL